MNATLRTEAYKCEAAQLAMRFPVPNDFVRTVIEDCSGDLNLAERWLAACALTGRYFAPRTLKVLKLTPWGEVR